jgi:rRNA-processing protein FCF1
VVGLERPFNEAIVYLDTNFFNWLADERVTAASIASVRNRRFRVPVSPAVLDEILVIEDAAHRKKLFGLVLDVCDGTGVLKPAHNLIADEIRATVEGTRSDPFLPFDSAQTLLENYSRGLLDENGLAVVRAELRRRNRNWKRRFGAFHNELCALDPSFTRKDAAPSFPEHYAGLASAFVADWASRANISGPFEPALLLKNRAVRTGIGYAVACDWDHKYATRKDRPVEPSDARDLQHAIMIGAACDVLVTQDRILKCRVKRASVEDLDVLGYHEFVARVL